MLLIETCFWLMVACAAYAYVLYPLLLALAVRLRGRPPVRRGSFAGTVSVVIAAHNEAGNIGRRVREFIDIFRETGVRGELVVVSDGSTDGTARAALEAGDESTRVIELAGKSGKAAALTVGCEAAGGEVIAFADARQTWAVDALPLMLQNFADREVGAVSGDLVLDTAPGVMVGVGAYWRFEKWLRRQEGRLHSLPGATGAISAVRRELFRPIPPGTILDDVYWPLQVVMQGYRVIHDERALAFDRLPERARDEFRRKVRTLSGNLQLVARLPSVLLPWRNPIWIQFISHKLLRLLVPWALLGMFVTSAVLAPHPLYTTALAMQTKGYVLALLGLFTSLSRLSIASAAASFLILNVAAWMAFWVWAFGRTGRSWSKTTYVKKQ